MPPIRILSICRDPAAEDAQYIVIELNEADLLKLAARKKAYLAAKELDIDLADHRFWSSAATYYQSLSFLKGKKPEAIEAMGLLDEEELFFLDKTMIETDCEAMRTECELLVVEESGVWWRSYPKHGDGELTSPMVTWDQLFQGRL